MADLRIIGAVGIKVRPDVRGFRKEAKAAIMAESRGLDKDIPVDLHVEAHTKRAKAAVEKLKKDAEKDNVLRLDVGVDFDSLKRAEKTLEKAFSGLRSEKIEVELDDRALLEQIGKVRNDIAKSNIEMTIDPTNIDDLNKVMNKIQQVRQDLKEKIDLQINVEDIDEWEKTIQDWLDENRTMTIEISEDRDVLTKAIDRINDALGKAKFESIEVNMDEESLLAQREDLQRRLREKPMEIKVDYDSQESIDKAISLLNQQLNESRAVALDVKMDEVSIKEAIHKLESFRDKEEDKNISLPVVPSGMALAAARLNYLTRPRIVPFYVTIDKKSLAIAEGLLRSLSGLNTLQSIGRRVETLITEFDRFSMRAGGWTAAIGGITDALGYMLTSLFTIGDGVANLVGLLAMVPALAASIAAGVAIHVAAWDGFKEAIDGSEEALAALPPQAQRAALALRGTWEAMQRPIQEVFWRGVGEELTTLAEEVLPIVQEGLTETALGAGQMVGAVARSLNKIARNGDLDRMFEQLDGAFMHAARAVEPFMDALNTLGLRGSHYLPELGMWLEELAIRFNNFIQEAEKAGDIDRWIEQGIQAAKDLWSVGGSLVDMFRGLTAAVNDAGGTGLGGLRDSMRDIADIMNREPFRSQMANIFKGMRQGASDLNIGLKDLGSTLGEVSEYFRDLLTLAGGLAGKILSGLARAIERVRFQQGTLDGLRDMGIAVDDLTPSFQHLGDIIGQMADLAGSVFKGIAPLINATLGALNRGLQIAGPALERAVPPLTTFMTGLVTLAEGPFIVLAELIANLANGLADLPGPVQGAVLALGGFLLLRGQFSSMLTAMNTFWNGQRTTWSRGVATTASLNERFKASFASMAASTEANAARVQAATGRINTAMATMGGAAKRAISPLGLVGKGLLGLVGGLPGLAIMGVATAFGVMATEAANARQHVENLQQTLDETGERTAQTSATVAQAFAADSVHFLEWLSGVREMGESAQMLGTDLNALAGIVTSTNGDYEKYIELLKSYPGAYRSNRMSLAEWADQMGISEQAARDFGVANIYHLVDGMQKQRDAVANSISGWQQLNGQLSEAHPNADGVGAALRTLSDNASTADQRVRALKDAMALLNGEAPKLDEAVHKMADTMDTLPDLFTKELTDAMGNITKVPVDMADLIDVKTGEIDPDNEIGRSLRTKIDEINNESLEVAVGMKLEGATPQEIAAYLQGVRNEFAGAAEQSNLSADQINAAFDRISNGTPEEIAIAMSLNIDPFMENAQIGEAKIAEFNATTAVADLAGDNTKFGLELATSYTDLNAWDRAIGVATADMDGTRASAEKRRLDQELIDLANTDPTVLAYMDPSILRREQDRVEAELAWLNRQTPTPTVLAETAQAQGAIGLIERLLNSIDGRVTRSRHEHTNTTINRIINSDGSTSRGNTGPLRTGQVGITNANGSVIDRMGRALAKGLGGQIKAFASGGIENHVAQIAKPNSTLRLWAEPETGGEAYIPLSPAKRGRSERILHEVARRFGKRVSDVQTFSDGGVVGPSDGSNINITMNSVPVNYAQETAGELMFALKQLKRGGRYQTPGASL